MSELSVLALQALAATSHEAALEAWRSRSRHRFRVLRLPGHAWKWRMRHAAVTFARQLARDRGAIDVVVATDMLDLAAFRGLAPIDVARAPHVLYMHENQFAYPDRAALPRDAHFAFTNLTSAAAADAVWWNSAWNRDALLAGAEELLAAVPDHAPRDLLDEIRDKSAIVPPPLDLPTFEPATRRPGPLRIVWAHRWEHDKAPDILFAALDELRVGGADFRLSVLGPSFRRVPDVFADARRRFADAIDRWGFVEPRAAYLDELARSDVFVSTARQEFFGLSTVEALAAGCWCLLPDRLAYPEVCAGLGAEHFHDGTAAAVARRLALLAERVLREGRPWPAAAQDASRRLADRFAAPRRAADMDDALAALAARRCYAGPNQGGPATYEPASEDRADRRSAPSR